MLGDTETALIEYLVLNAPTFVGLLIALLVMWRMLGRKEKEIERLQRHNDRLILWCQRCDNPDMPPIDGGESVYASG